MDFRTIRYEQLGAVVRITANRPEVLNAQSRVMILELDEAFRAASDDDAIRVIIVAGAGAHFSAGHDLGSPDELEDQKAHPVGPGLPENLRRLSELYLETAAGGSRAGPGRPGGPSGPRAHPGCRGRGPPRSAPRRPPR